MDPKRRLTFQPQIMLHLLKMSIMMKKKERKMDRRLKHKPNIKFKQNDQKL